MVRRLVSALGLVMAFAIPVRADSAPVSIWYRTTNGCPDGAAFVSRLSELGKAARLAGAGDRVDFVVTLGAGVGEEGSSGRLERQTRGGTVAIREYRDARCEQVAEALALTLDLAIEPDTSPRAAPDADDIAPSPAVPSPGREHASADVPRSHGTAPSEAPVAARSEGGALTFGVQATLATGVAPGPLPGAGSFIELPMGLTGLRALRATLLGGHGQSQAAARRELEVTLLVARVEACPFEWRGSAVLLRPCVGVDAGLLRARGDEPLGASDSGFWSAAVGLGRASALLGRGFSLELSAGARVPLLRYEMGTRDGSAVWSRTRSVGLDTSLGGAWSFP